MVRYDTRGNGAANNPVRKAGQSKHLKLQKILHSLGHFFCHSYADSGLLVTFTPCLFHSTGERDKKAVPEEMEGVFLSVRDPWTDCILC